MRLSDLKFKLNYHLTDKRWFHDFDIIPVNDNEFQVKLVVRKSFSLKYLDDLAIKLNQVLDVVNVQRKFVKDLYVLEFKVYYEEREDDF